MPIYNKAALMERIEVLEADARIKAANLEQALARVAELEAELARLRAQEPVSWKHDCAGLCTNGVELWIDACPHCGKPRAAPPAQPALSQKDKEQAAFEDWLIAECPSGDVEAVQRQWEESSEYLELQDDAPAQPAHADEFRCPLCLDDPANIAQPAPAQRLSDEPNWKLVGAIIDAHSRTKAGGMLSGTSDWGAFIARAIEAAIVPLGYVLVPVESLRRWRAAFAEELAAYDIDPPIHHVKTSHDEIDAMIASAPKGQP